MDRPAGPESTKSFGFSQVSAAAGSGWAQANRDRLRVQGRERTLPAPGTVESRPQPRMGRSSRLIRLVMTIECARPRRGEILPCSRECYPQMQRTRPDCHGGLAPSESKTRRARRSVSSSRSSVASLTTPPEAGNQSGQVARAHDEAIWKGDSVGTRLGQQGHAYRSSRGAEPNVDRC